MSDVATMQMTFQGLAEPRSAGEKVKQLIERAARRAGFSYTRAFDIWYGKARRIEPEEAEAINKAALKNNREIAANELFEIRLRLERLEAIVASNDPDFVRPTLAAIGERLRQMGGALGAVARSGDRQAIVGRKPR